MGKTKLILTPSAWKPCGSCRSCASCKNSTASMQDSRGPCFWCDAGRRYQPRNFCPECGRPLVPKAWGMLKEKLSVAIEQKEE